MGYDYEIQFRQGKENKAADGLSRVFSAQLLTMALSTISSTLLDSIKASWAQDPHLQSLIQALEAGQPHPHYTWQ